MFGNKRLAKRSIVGTRVSALWPQDGRFYPGIIQSQLSEDTITSSGVYVVKFNDGHCLNIKSKLIIGHGFQPITSVTLKWGQKVFITLNGREVSGVVLRHSRETDEVVINVRTPSGETFEASRRLEDVRLLESRKSARLVDQPDTDYSKLADLQLGNVMSEYQGHKKRVPSHVIDVPLADSDKNERHRRQRHLSEDLPDNDHGGDFCDVEMMDERIAAMVLTSLSVSPKSPSVGQQHSHTHTGSKDYLDTQLTCPDSHLSSSVASSGFYSGHSERDDHSPPLPPLSESAPALMGYQPPTPASDDDSSNSSGRLLICEEEEDIVYKCTWRGCKETCTSRNQMERHIRRQHFNRDSDLELTDNEEDFHYTEVNVSSQSINTMTKSFAAMNTSSRSPLEENRSRHASEDLVSVSAASVPASSNKSSLSPEAAVYVINNVGDGVKKVMDHDYQRKNAKIALASSVPTGNLVLNVEQPKSLPIAISEGQIQKSLSWQIHSSPSGHLISPPQRPNKPTPQERLHQHQAQSPKSGMPPTTFKVAQHRRPRSEVRKCRKVYGMENRDQWCTQCKWKKACTRFID
ncbi:zinc finger protein 704-like [Biomphalaria glabrata]|uniref:Zinc finger protein 704-like n=1 Tax=Biomphalaria glabrata TaxID=6526 RepID=A0A9W2Z836_BIOGL|nr:zinc finger protein 704-like [Biomphalaria glabrata]